MWLDFKPIPSVAHQARTAKCLGTYIPGHGSSDPEGPLLECHSPLIDSIPGSTDQETVLRTETQIQLNARERWIKTPLHA